MKLFRKIFYICVCTGLLITSVGIQPVYAASITVNTNADTLANDGFCTLREAITNANDDAATYPDCAAGSGADSITFAGNYTITANNGTLNIFSDITISGNGTSDTIVQASTCNPITTPGGCTPASYRVFAIAAGSVTFNDMTIRYGNCTSCITQGSTGGGISNFGSLLTLNNVNISDNTALLGGGVLSSVGNVLITNSTFSGNFGSGNGGAIFNGAGTLTIIQSSFSGNTTAGAGGAIVINSASNVVDSTFSDNTSAGIGGGIYYTTGTQNITNSTFSGNSGFNGGGIYSGAGVTLTVTNSTFSGNSGSNGGGIFFGNGTLNYSNTIIANSSAGGDCSGFGPISTNINNLVEDGGCSASLSGDPNLAPLADNGGPTQTHALLSGSTAIDAGNATTCANAPVNNLDQRGVTRPQGAGCDIGAFEVDDTFPTVVSDSLVASYASNAGPSSFTVTFSENVYDPAGDSDPDDVTNPANYLIVEGGVNNIFDTLSCFGGVAGDDTQVTVSSVTYNAGLFTATVNLSSALPNGTYRLFVCGTTSINDLALNELNNGLTDYTFDFIVGTATITVPPVTASSLPDTGFAPNRITSLPHQPAELAYTAVGDIWLEIPSQNIKSNIVGIPQSQDNTWDVTWLGNDTGWLNSTAFPTWNGNSVLTAHVTDSNGLPGPFANLKTLQYGDQIIVHLFGQQYVYEVQNSRMVRPYTTNYAFTSLQDHSYLTLITCQGYIPFSDTYLFRRVVRAVLVDVK